MFNNKRIAQLEKELAEEKALRKELLERLNHISTQIWDTQKMVSRLNPKPQTIINYDATAIDLAKEISTMPTKTHCNHGRCGLAYMVDTLFIRKILLSNVGDLKIVKSEKQLE